MKIFLKRFFDFVKRNGDVEYTAVTIGDDFRDGFEKLVKKNRNLLSDHGVNINKVRFIFTPSFTYDTDKNKINPTFVAMLPSKSNAPIIEIGKPENVVSDTVVNYKVDDNYDFIKELVKNSKRGIVIYIIEHQDAVKDDGTLFNYEFGVDSEVLRLRDLDELHIETEESELIL